MLFGVIAVTGLVAALGTVLARNLVHAALFLAAFFFVIACQFVLLEAEFLAAIQVLVYIGAVAVLILFGIMLTRNIQGDETTGGRWYTRLPGALAAAAVLAVLIVGIGGRKFNRGALGWGDVEVRPTFPAGQPTTDPRATVLREGMAVTVGTELMTRYVVPFEVAGLLLTAAAVGAIALAYHDRSEDEPPTAERQRRAGAAASGPNGPAVTTHASRNPASTTR